MLFNIKSIAYFQLCIDLLAHIANRICITQIAKVVTWVNSDKKPLWWRQVIRKVMEQGELQQQDFQLIYQVAKMEFGLLQKTANFPNYIKAVAVAGFETEAAPVTLTSLGNVKNVSSLIEGVALNFPITLGGQVA
jgi:hypothetical protein